MESISLVTAFLIGVAGSVHCVGMCGGIVSAFSVFIPKGSASLPYYLLYNIGRISSYGVIGALAGALGSGFAQSHQQAMHWLTLFAALMLILLGLYIANWWKILTQLEKVGKHVWKYVQPLTKKLLPLSSPIKALPFGMLWGWLPCGLVYSTLTWSVASGSFIQGALIMICFGLGTLPAMLAMGLSANSVKTWLAKPMIQKIIGTSLIIYGLILIKESVN
ncbi:sulfite exporter TauE/SafE family protein [Aestuariibacter sp. AA17]|uniref:Sulfite exporter TauE/SafE family protein n=1 Tax=Fluctibacter corallii TaxID=2984329 RepID=A0ABT3A6D5_9ALTE|nr:sulfite exporter TauE/SafE family protein [Aestuariibacter sp. AA17]MCV2884213.1 sulfite exporter TauE/SafE family protein [Aestuariibacter sp. AA17]